MNLPQISPFLPKASVFRRNDPETTPKLPQTCPNSSPITPKLPQSARNHPQTSPNHSQTSPKCMKLPAPNSFQITPKQQTSHVPKVPPETSPKLREIVSQKLSLCSKSSQKRTSMLRDSKNVLERLKLASARDRC